MFVILLDGFAARPRLSSSGCRMSKRGFLQSSKQIAS
jgi:hypothetical protein